MKTLIAMTPVQIASSVIEKLKEQNRISMDALQKTQSDMTLLERQLIEKEQLIKILEGKLNSGSNTYLEMSNRQKNISIKHLELQIQKLLKENEDLECQINVAKSDICAKCESKYLLGGPVESKPTSKSVRKGKLKTVPTKQLPDAELQKREKMLERIIEHKDNRIVSLTKDIHRLTQAEKELSSKVYRLTKLLPMSHMPSEVITECLLKEIQSLEMQIQQYQEKHDKLNVDIGQKKRSKSYSNLCDLKSKVSFQGSDVNEETDSSSKKLNKFNSTSSEKNIGLSRENSSKSDDNAVSKLHLLYNDVIELKRLFADENEKLFLNLTKESMRKDMLKKQWEEIMYRLTEIAESIENILKTNLDFAGNKSTVSNDKENVILHLQERLKDSIELATRYENKMTELKSTIKRLEDQIQKDKISHQYTQTDVRRLSNESVGKVASENSVDVLHLKDLLNEKQKQLDSTESHLKTYQNFVAQLQGIPNSSQVNLPQSSSIGSKQTASNPVDNETSASNTNNETRFGNKPSKESFTSLESKLEISEKNIKTLEDVVESLQKVIKNLRLENDKLGSEINLAKNNKLASESNINASLKMKLKQTEDELVKVQSVNKDLENSVHSLREENSISQENLLDANNKLASLQEAHSQQTILQSKLNVAEKKINVLESNIEKLKDENARLATTMQISETRKSLEAEDSILSLQNKLIVKDDEIKTLKESLHAIESKAIEMNHYRKTLRQEIENLCDVLLEKSDPNKSLESRKAIYKAEVLQSAKALLQLDEDYNEQSKNMNKEGALEEMNQQVSVYLTEVARIHELLTIKNQQKNDLLKEYLDGNDGVNLPGLASTSGIGMLSSSSRDSSGKSASSTTSESSASSSNKSSRVEANKARNVRSQTDLNSKAVQEELDAKSITSYLLSRCSQLESLLEKEQKEHSMCQKESDKLRQSLSDLQAQLKNKNGVAKRLNALIEMIRSKGGSDEIAMEQLRSDIKWLVDENHKVFEKIAFTQTELCKCKEENTRVQNDLDNVKRQLFNEKYEHAKVNNELKHLREQLFAKTTFSLSNEELLS